MNPFQTAFRVSYSDTDQMGFMHHSNYLKYYETARWELFRHIGIPYPEIENEGIILPVINISIKYNKPTCYDQKILVFTIVKAFSGARISFEYQIMNEAGEIINEAQVQVACVNKVTGKPCVPPGKITNAINGLINS